MSKGELLNTDALDKQWKNRLEHSEHVTTYFACYMMFLYDILELQLSGVAVQLITQLTCCTYISITHMCDECPLIPDSHAAVRSSSAASDPTTEKLECFLDHRSLLGMLQQRSSSLDATPTQPGSRPPITPRQAAVSDPAVLRSRLGREAFLLNYKVGYCLTALARCCE